MRVQTEITQVVRVTKAAKERFENPEEKNIDNCEFSLRHYLASQKAENND